MWSPSFDELGTVNLNDNAHVKVQLNTFTDARKNPALIAENHENPQVRQVTTKDDVAACVGDHVKETLGNAGLNMVDGDDDVIVSGEIRDFFVHEGDPYVGNVAIYVPVTNHDGNAELWQGVVSGDATNFGRSYKADNYYETLSNAVLKATNNLLNTPGFRDALMTH